MFYKHHSSCIKEHCYLYKTIKIAFSNFACIFFSTAFSGPTIRSISRHYLRFLPYINQLLGLEAGIKHKYVIYLSLILNVLHTIDYFCFYDLNITITIELVPDFKRMPVL